MDGIDDGRGSKHRAARIETARLHAVMIYLCEDARIIGMYRARQTAISRDDARIEAMYQFLIGPIARMDRLLLGNDQATAALRAFGVIGDQARPRQVRLRQVGQVGGKDHAVRYNRLTDADG